MSDPAQALDDSPLLAGTNRLEVLMFRLERSDDPSASDLFGLNVFKVRELMKTPKLTRIPDSPEYLVGAANIRGVAVPVIDLQSYCGVQSDCPPQILVVTEFSRSVQGFLVHEVDTIAQLVWSDIKPLPSVLANEWASVVTAVSLLEDDRLLLILDVERVLADIFGDRMPDPVVDDIPATLDGRLVYYADDSRVARMQIAMVLDGLNIPHQSANNGDEALQALTRMADAADADNVRLDTRLQAIITDVEMPVMDGYVLTQKIKRDRRFDGIPVLMHSSLSSTENIRLGMEVGADGYMPKLRPDELTQELARLVGEASANDASHPAAIAARA